MTRPITDPSDREIVSIERLSKKYQICLIAAQSVTSGIKHVEPYDLITIANLLFTTHNQDKNS